MCNRVIFHYLRWICFASEAFHTYRVGDMRESIRRLCGDAVADDCPPLLGANEEGEMNSYRPLPRRGLWYMAGMSSRIRTCPLSPID